MRPCPLFHRFRRRSRRWRSPGRPAWSRRRSTTPIDGIAPIDSVGQLSRSTASQVDVDRPRPPRRRATPAGGSPSARAGQMLSQARWAASGGALSDGALDCDRRRASSSRTSRSGRTAISRGSACCSAARAPAAMLGVAGEAYALGADAGDPDRMVGRRRGRRSSRRPPGHEAWARFRTGNSAIDYVRPIGHRRRFAAAQRRPDRAAAAAAGGACVLDQYGAADVAGARGDAVAAMARRPGRSARSRRGTAPDNQLLAQLHAARRAARTALPALLDAGRQADRRRSIRRRCGGGALRRDPSLAYIAAADADARPPTPPTPTDTIRRTTVVATERRRRGDPRVTVQFDTPERRGGHRDRGRGARRAGRAVGASTTSLAIGGVSVMRVDL